MKKQNRVKLRHATGRKRIEDRSRQANWAQVQIAAGLCRVCGGKCGINPRTGKHYLLCPRHRASVAASQKVLMRRRRLNAKC